MNKYEKAFKNVLIKRGSIKSFKAIMELVERATPKKPKIIDCEDYTLAYCPVCYNEVVIGECCNDNDCRQALDWSDENERMSKVTREDIELLYKVREMLGISKERTKLSVLIRRLEQPCTNLPITDKELERDFYRLSECVRNSDDERAIQHIKTKIAQLEKENSAMDDTITDLSLTNVMLNKKLDKIREVIDERADTSPYHFKPLPYYFKTIKSILESEDK